VPSNLSAQRQHSGASQLSTQRQLGEVSVGFGDYSQVDMLVDMR